MTKLSAHSFLPAELRTIVTVNEGRNKAKRIARFHHKAKRAAAVKQAWQYKSRAPKLKFYSIYLGF